MGPGTPGALPTTPQAYLPLLVHPRTHYCWVSPDGDPIGLVVIPPAGLVETTIKQYNMYMLVHNVLLTFKIVGSVLNP